MLMLPSFADLCRDLRVTITCGLNASDVTGTCGQSAAWEWDQAIPRCEKRQDAGYSFPVLVPCPSVLTRTECPK